MAQYSINIEDEKYECTFETIGTTNDLSLIAIIGIEKDEEEGGEGDTPEDPGDTPLSYNTITIPSYITITNTDSPDPIDLYVKQIGNGVYLPEDVSGVIISDGISSIGNDSFKYSKALEQINIPSSIISIGTNTLTYNTSLSGISISSENPKYKSVDNYIYSYISEQITVDDTPTTKITYTDLILCPASKTSIAFSDDTSSISAIGPYAFAGCDKISNIDNIPDNVSYIKAGAFSDCTELATINIGKNINYIDNTAFNGCPNIFITVSNENSKYSSVRGGLYNESGTIFIKCPGIVYEYDIPESVTEIKSNAFNDVLNISYINFLGKPPTSAPNPLCNHQVNGTYVSKYKNDWAEVIDNNKWHGLIMSLAQQKTENVEFTYIIEGDNAYITGLATTFSSGKLSIPPSIDNINIVGIKKYAFSNINTLVSITLPPTITNIEPYAFYNCTGLTTVVLPTTLNIIDNSTFFGCAALTNIELPDTLVIINDRAFYGCVTLSKITIPKNVSEIGSLAFYGCDQLNIEFLGKPPSVSYDTFPLTNGTYLDTYKVEWDTVLNHGIWNNLTLTMVKDPNTEPEPDTPVNPEPEQKTPINFRIYNKQVIFNDSNNKITNPTIYIAGLVLETDIETGKEHPVKGLFINDNIKLNSYISWESRGILSSMD